VPFRTLTPVQRTSVDVAALRAGAVVRRRSPVVKPLRKLRGQALRVDNRLGGDAARAGEPAVQRDPTTKEQPMTTVLDTTVEPIVHPTERPVHLIVVADHQPGAHRTDSDEIGWWLPLIGPTSAILARTLAHRARQGEATWDTAYLTRRIGLGNGIGRLWTVLNRLDTFRCLTFVSTNVATIRLALPELTAHQLTHLPDDMAEAYRARFWR
jgi:hypothetical protein